MRTAERILAGLGAIAGLIVAIDTYILKSRLADSLRLPESVPTGLVALIVFAFSATIVLSARHRARNEKPAKPLSIQQPDARVPKLEDKVRDLQEEAARLSERLKQYKALPSRIVGLLATDDHSFDRLAHLLRFDDTDSGSNEALQSVLGELVSDGTVVERLGKYRLASRDRF